MARWFGRSRSRSYDRAGSAAESEHLEPLGVSDDLRLAYGRTGDPKLLRGAIQAAELAVQVYPVDDVRHAAALSALCMLHRLSWERERAAADLVKAVDYGRRAVDKSPPGDPVLPRHMSSLATALQEVYDSTKDQEAIDEAIALYRGCLDIMPVRAAGLGEERVAQESNLANALLRKGRTLKDVAFLDEAARHARAALRDTPDDHPMHALRLVNLGGVLLGLVQTGRHEHMAAVEDMYTRGLRELPQTHPARPGLEQTLAVVKALRRQHGV
jgi:tetratricopeptide (TPR) repeat protein